jgi:hypothetical protein
VHIVNEKDTAFNNLVMIAESVCKRLNSVGEENEFWVNGEYNKFVSEWALINHMEQVQLDNTTTERDLMLIFDSPTKNDQKNTSILKSPKSSKLEIMDRSSPMFRGSPRSNLNFMTGDSGTFLHDVRSSATMSQMK